MAVHGGAWRCMAVRGGAWRCVAVRGSAWRCVAVGSARSISDSDPTYSIPTSSNLTLYRYMRRLVAVSEMETGSSSSPVPQNSVIIRPWVYFPSTPCAFSSTEAFTACRGTYISIAWMPACRVGSISSPPSSGSPAGGCGSRSGGREGSWCPYGLPSYVSEGFCFSIPSSSSVAISGRQTAVDHGRAGCTRRRQP